MSWLLLTEIFPTGIKGRAVAAASIVNWGTNIVVSMTFLEVIGNTLVLLFFVNVKLIFIWRVFNLYLYINLYIIFMIIIFIFFYLGSIGPFWTFLTYALIGVVAIFFICHFVPETKGKSLELVSAELNQGYVFTAVTTNEDICLLLCGSAGSQ